MSDSLYVRGKIQIGPTDCLLNVDDVIAFIRKYGGGLPVDGGEEIAQFIIDKLFPIFPLAQRVATCDMHPIGQITIADSYVGLLPFDKVTIEMLERGELVLSEEAQFTLDDVKVLLKATGSFTVWPKHGLAGTNQVELDPTFNVKDWLFLFQKGSSPKDDANGAFISLLGVLTHLCALLRGLGFKRLFIVGLAYDVCAGLTAIQGAILGFKVFVIKQGTRAINIPANGDYPGSVALIEAEFVRAGVKVIEDVEQLQLAA